MPWDVKKNGDQYCVYKKGEDTPIKGGCHSTRSAAAAHQRALYANVKESYSHQTMVFSLEGTTKHTKQELLDGVWIHAVPYDTVQHPIFGEVVTDKARAEQFKRNFDGGVVGNDVKITFEHFGKDPAKGYKAAGWIKEVEPRDDGLWQKISFTGEAADEILDGAWRYFSAEWEPLFFDSHGEVHTDVMVGGALTNDPYYDGTVPLNFSSLLLDEAADWEHSEPGTGPTPREDEPHDPGQAQGTRSPSKPNPEPDIPDELEASMNEEELKALREKLGLADDGDVTEAVDSILAELAPIRAAGEEANKQLSFSRDYPAEAERLATLENADRDSKAFAFSRVYENSRLTTKEGEGDEAKEVPTTQGFSALTLDKIRDAHIAMSTGTIREEHLKSLLDSIMSTGLVDYGERGSAVEAPETDLSDAPMAFSAKITEIAVNDKLDTTAALAIAINKYPELYKAYREAVGARS